MSKGKRNSLFRSKYMDVDLNSLDRESREKVLISIRRDVIFRFLFGIGLFIASLVVAVVAL